MENVSAFWWQLCSSELTQHLTSSITGDRFLQHTLYYYAFERFKLSNSKILKIILGVLFHYQGGKKTQT